VIGRTTGTFVKRLNASGEMIRKPAAVPSARDPGDGSSPTSQISAALHQISSPPTGLSLSHSRSSLLRRALLSHRASSLVKCNSASVAAAPHDEPTALHRRQAYLGTRPQTQDVEQRRQGVPASMTEPPTLRSFVCALRPPTSYI